MRSWQILKIWGIPFKIHSYWFVLLFIFAWSISNQINLTLSDIYDIRQSWLIGFFTSFFLLVSIFIHQIFHTYICLNEGVEIKNITFFFLGAILQIEKDCQNALGNIKISLVRPICCFLTSFFLLLVVNSTNSKEEIIINIISRVGILNLFLGILNLIPFGSLDGGHLFKSLIWYFSGSKKKGRSVLNNFTFFTSIAVCLFGLFCLFNLSFYYGSIIIFLGILGINTSKSDSQFLKIEEILKYSKAFELKLKPLRKIEYDVTIKEFNKLLQNEQQNLNNYFFITKNGRWEGFLSRESLKVFSTKKWDIKSVEDCKKSIKDFPSCNEKEPLWEIIEKIENTHEGLLLIVNSLGIPQGIVDRNSIGFFVLKKLGFDISIELLGKLKTKKNTYPLGIELPKIIGLMKTKGEID